MLWRQEGFTYADSFDVAGNRYRGLRPGGQRIPITEANLSGLLVKPEVAEKQLAAETPMPPSPSDEGKSAGPLPEGFDQGDKVVPPPQPTVNTPPKRFHGTVTLDATRVGRDAGKIAEEIIAHLTGLAGTKVTVTLEVEADIPAGVPDHVVRTVTENGRSLKFTSQGFEKE